MPPIIQNKKIKQTSVKHGKSTSVLESVSRRNRKPRFLLREKKKKNIGKIGRILGQWKSKVDASVNTEICGFRGETI